MERQGSAPAPPAPHGAARCRDGRNGMAGLSPHLLASRSRDARFSWRTLGRHRGAGWQGCPLCRHPGDTMARPEDAMVQPQVLPGRRAAEPPARTSLPMGPSGPCSPCEIKAGQCERATGAVLVSRCPLLQGAGVCTVPPHPAALTGGPGWPGGPGCPGIPGRPRSPAEPRSPFRPCGEAGRSPERQSQRRMGTMTPEPTLRGTHPAPSRPPHRGL